MRSFTFLISVMVSLTAGLTLRAAEPVASPSAVANDGTIVITATRDEAGRQTVPIIVDVVTGEDLKRDGYPDRLQDQLRCISGLSISQDFGGFAGGGGIYIRGARPQQTQIMFDGVPFNNPAAIQGQVGHELFLLPGMDRIELAKGAQSGLYGSGASGGVLNLIGVDPGVESHVSARAEYGSFNTFAHDIQASGPLSGDKNLGFVVAANGLISDGFSPQASYDANGDPKGFDAAGYSRIGFFGKLRWTDDKTKIYSSITRQQASESYDNSGPNDLAKLNFDSWRFQGGARVLLTKGIEVAGDFAYTTYVSDFSTSGKYDSRDEYGSIRATLTPYESVEMMVGGDLRRQTAMTVDLDSVTHDTGVWAQVLGNWAGVRPQLVVRRDAYSNAGNANTYRFGLAYGLFNDCWVWHAATGTGFRAPSMYELYSPYGNTDLQPERTATYEIGHRLELGEETVRLEQTMFYTQFKEAIVWTPDATPVFGHYQNLTPIDLAYVRGIENELEWNANQSLRIKASATIQDSNDGAGQGMKMTLTPHFTAGMEVNWRFVVHNQLLWITPGVDYLGRRYQDNANSIELHDLMTLRLAFGWEAARNVTIYARGDNLMDKMEATYLQAPSMFGPGSSFTSKPRSFTVGVEARF